MNEPQKTAWSELKHQLGIHGQNNLRLKPPPSTLQQTKSRNLINICDQIFETRMLSDQSYFKHDDQANDWLIKDRERSIYTGTSTVNIETTCWVFSRIFMQRHQVFGQSVPWESSISSRISLTRQWMIFQKYKQIEYKTIVSDCIGQLNMSSI